MATSRKKLIEELLTRGVERVYPSREALDKILEGKKRLKVYAGFDATGPHLHLGHMEQLLVLRRFQALGHQVIFLIGDFTAQIGDPTDKLAARKPLSFEEVQENMKTFVDQAGKILQFGGLNPVKIEFNSHWLRELTLKDVLELSSKVTVQQMIERDMFQERLKAEKPIGLHEFMYPLLQGYDSVAMDVDVEVGGSDQTFNMLMGRDLQRSLHDKEKFVVATKLLVHPVNGKKLMNKSEGGMINLDDEPDEVFGKLMSLDDESMFPIAELCTEIPLIEIEKIRQDIKKDLNPRDAKLQIAEAVCEIMFGTRAATHARENFVARFSKKDFKDVKEVSLSKEALEDYASLVAYLNDSSKSEARRLIEQGGVEVSGEKIKNLKTSVADVRGKIVKIGKKKIFKVK